MTTDDSQTAASGLAAAADLEDPCRDRAKARPRSDAGLRRFRADRRVAYAVRGAALRAATALRRRRRGGDDRTVARPRTGGRGRGSRRLGVSVGAVLVPPEPG